MKFPTLAAASIAISLALINAKALSQSNGDVVNQLPDLIFTGDSNGNIIKCR